MDFKQRDKELGRGILQVKRNIDGLHGAPPRERRERLEEIDQLLDDCERDFKYMQKDVRTMPPRHRRECNEVIKDRKLDLEDLRLDVQEVKARDGSSRNRGRNANNEQRRGPATNEEFMSYGAKVQNDSKDSLDRTLERIAATEQVGKSITGKLGEQTEQIVRIQTELETIDSELERAKKVMNRLLGRMAGDKLCWVCIFLLVAAIATVIGLKIAGYGGIQDPREAYLHMRAMGNATHANNSPNVDSAH